MINEILEDTRSYIRSIRKYVLLSAVIFFGAFMAGFMATEIYPQEIKGYIEEAMSFFDAMQSPTQWGTFLLIFQNNVKAMLIVVALGIFLGFFSLTFLIANGFILGIFGYLFASQGMLPVFIMGILPHGIIEIPCMLFAAAAGFKVGATVLKKIFGRKVSLTVEIADCLKFAVTFIVPALALAAFIEAYITPYFIALAQMGMGADNSLQI